MKKILYIGNFSFPFGNASGKRVFGNGKLFKKIGYDVIFIGMDAQVDNSTPLKETESIYQDFLSYNLSYPKDGSDWISYKKTFNKVIDFIKKEKIGTDLKAVIYYGNPRLSLFNSLLIKWCKDKNIKIVSDCVDWLTPKSDSLIFNIIKWADTTYQKAYLNKKVDGVITISSYLENYYKKNGMQTVIIPPLSTNDVKELGDTTYNKHINIIYAGLPFKIGTVINDVTALKDRIDKQIMLLSKVKEKGVNFIFNIYGFTKDEYLKALPKQEPFLKTLGDSIVFHGHKENAYIIEKLKLSDFSILLRDIKKDTMAGFPTKVSESMSYGIPVITNNTSDLEKYIRNGENGFLLDLNDESKAIEKLEKILQLNRGSIDTMKNRCSQENIFSFEKYQNAIKSFFLVI